MAPSDKDLARSLVQQGLLPLETVRQALQRVEQWQQAGQTIGLGEFLVRKGLLRPEVYQNLVYGSAGIPSQSPQQGPHPAGEPQYDSAGAADRGSDSGNARALHGSGPRGEAAFRPGEDGVPSRFGPYEIIEEIARGGMGVVYRARHEDFPNRSVALKVLLKGEMASDSDLKRFIREAKSAGALSHPNIVGVHSFGEIEGTTYFTMDFVEGEDLADTLVGTPRPVAASLRLMLQICEAIAFAHERGIIHRDLKPANVLLTTQGRPVLTDFGLARSLDSNTKLTKTGTVLGTPHYMSPEQCRGADLDGRSDIWALGVIFYQMLTHRLPFEGETALDLYQKINETHPVPPREHRSSIPVPVETICLRAIEKDPDDRYETAREMANDIQRFLHGDRIVARRIGTLGRLRRRVARHPVAVGIGFAVVAGLLIGGMILQTTLSNWSAQQKKKEIAAERVRLRATVEEMAGRVDRAIAEATSAARENDLETARTRLDEVATAIGELEARLLTPKFPVNTETLKKLSEKLTPLRDALLIGRARVLRLGGEPTAAIERLAERAEDENVPLALRHLLGKLYHEVGDYEAALRTLTRVLNQEPENVEALLLRARVALALGDLERAFVDLNDARSAGADPATVTLLEARVLATNGRLEEARDLLIRDLSETTPLPILLEAARLEARTGRSAKAWTLFEQAGDLAPESPEVFAARAEFFIQDSRLGLALEDLATARKLAPDDPGLLLREAELRLLRGAPPEPIADDIQALLVTGDLKKNEIARAKLLLGDLAFDRGTPTEAEALYREAIETDAFFHSAHRRLGIVLLRQKRYYDAEKSFQAVLNRRPRDVAAREGLAFTRARLEKKEEALHLATQLAEETDRIAPLLLIGELQEDANPDRAKKAYIRANRLREEMRGLEGYLIRRLDRLWTLVQRPKKRLSARFRSRLPAQLERTASALLRTQIYPALAKGALALLANDGKKVHRLAHAALGWNPRLVPIHIMVAKRLGGGTPSEGIKHMRLALQYGENKAEWWNSLGYYHWRAKEYARAIPCFEKALDLKPLYPLALKNIRVNQEALGRTAAVAETEKRLARMEERLQQAQAAFRQAQRARRRRNGPAALEAIEKARNLGLDSPEVQLEYSYILFLVGQVSESQLEFCRVMSRLPRIEDEFADSLVQASKLGSLKAFIPKINAILEETPNDLGAITLRGLVRVLGMVVQRDRVRMPDVLQALEDLDRAIQRVPDFVVALAYRGLAYHLLGFPGRAEEDWNLAESMIDRPPSVIPFYRSIQWARRGDRDAAYEALRKAVDRGLHVESRLEVPLYPEPFRQSLEFERIIKKR